MNKLKKYVCLLLLLFSCHLSARSQQTDLRNEQKMEELAESLAETEDGAAESSILLDDLNYFSEHPIFINLVGEEELLHSNLFNFRQVKNIVDYRQKYGGFLTVKELAVMGGFSEERLSRLESLVRFDMEPDSFQRRRDKIVHQTLLFRMKETFPKSAGYSSVKEKPAVYEGSPIGYFSRYRADIGKRIGIGITAENDGGEDLFRRSNSSGPDFVSGFITWSGEKWIRKVVVGDFHLRFGQGLNLWSGGGVSYASDLSSLMRTGEGIRPYSSSDENLFFRGLAVQMALKPLKLSIFYSDKNKDANLEQDANGQNVITSFRTDGLHRTGSEIADEKEVRDRMTGGYADFGFSNWRFGVLASFQKLDLPVVPKDAPYLAKSFSGTTNCNFGADYHWILNQISFFGEAGISGNLKPAFVHGVIWKAHPQLSLSWLYRYFAPSFQTFYSGAFAEGSGGKNEQGFYAAFEYFPIARLKLSGQADLFSFPWMTFQTITPSHGQTFSLQSEVSITSSLHLYLHARIVRKPQKVSGSTGIPEQWDETTSKWRLHCDWKVNEYLQLRSRVEYVRYQYRNINEQGGLIFQDFIFTASHQLKFWFRIVGYATDGYNSRVYAFENDLLYYFAIPEFHGRGVRSYINLKWQPCRLFSLFLKGGYTLRENAQVMGSGADATPGNHRFDVRGQICLRF